MEQLFVYRRNTHSRWRRKSEGGCSQHFKPVGVASLEPLSDNLRRISEYFEKDKALERRFQTVMVDEPDVTSAVAILRDLKRYENHHSQIKDEAVVAAVEFSHRYISDRFCPIK